ncbi:MAG: hypothetical protein R3C58_04760, partial [Parvularculaceae bacterium]
MSVELSPAGQQAHDNKPSRRTVNSFLSDLVRDGLLSESDKKRVFEIAQTSVTPVDQILCNLGVVTEDALAASYAKICGLIRWNGQRPELRSGEADTINRRFLESRRIFPLSRANNVITAALVDPLDEVGITGLEFALGAKVAPQIVTASEFERLLAAAGGESEDAAPIADGAAASDDAAKLKDLASAEPAVRLVNRLIGEASRARASDIHIEPKERDVHVRRRVDGVLTISETLTRAQGLSAISRLKILA